MPYFVVVKLTKACRAGQKVFAELSSLKEVYNNYGSKRLFRRRLGHGDRVKGVITKYHFSVDKEFNSNYNDGFFKQLNNLENERKSKNCS